MIQCECGDFLGVKVNKSHLKSLRHRVWILEKKLRNEGFWKVTARKGFLVHLRGVEVRQEETGLTPKSKSFKQAWVKPAWVGRVLNAATTSSSRYVELLNVLLEKGWSGDAKAALHFAQGMCTYEEALVMDVLDP